MLLSASALNLVVTIIYEIYCFKGRRLTSPNLKRTTKLGITIYVYHSVTLTQVITVASRKGTIISIQSQ